MIQLITTENIICDIDALISDYSDWTDFELEPIDQYKLWLFN